MIEMARIVKKTEHIPVDQWDTAENPIAESDRIFRNVRGEIILPLAEWFYNCSDEKRQLDYFVTTNKRSYNSEETRVHICKYLNYFEKYYDLDRELIMIIHEIKVCIDYTKEYSIDDFMYDINRYIIRNRKLGKRIRQFVEDNYAMQLSSNNNKTPNLQFENKHAKVLYEISLMMNMYIPLATHYMYIHLIKKSADIQDFMLRLFDLCVIKYEEERGIYIFDKMYETATSVVNKSKNPDRILWSKNAIRGVNTTTHTKDSVIDVILQIIPKYYYDNHIINFNYSANRKCLKYKITGIKYECPFIPLSSSKRDSDQNSEMDRYESRITKKDESLYMINKVIAEQTVKRVESLYGPFSEKEIEHYRRKLTKDGKPVRNEFQSQMIGYLFFKEFGEPESIKAVPQIDYIKLIIAAKRILKKSGMLILPYIMSCRVIRLAARKNINKKEMTRLETGEIYQSIINKYKNPSIKQKMLEIVGRIISSSFEIIDFDEEKDCPTPLDGQQLPIINDIIMEELMFFISII